MTPETLILPDRQLAYQYLPGHPDRPGVLFLGGFASDMTGAKASFLSERCATAGISYTRFDYRGHGQSSDDFKTGTIGQWRDDAAAILAQICQGPQILVGSSMGGWIALLLALAAPERVKGLVGIAAAPDFTEDLMWLKFSPEQRQRLAEDGFVYEADASPDHRIPVTRQLIEEGRQHLLLRKIIPVTAPVRLLQGLDDREVPWQHALRIVENLANEDVRLTLIKNGDHRLNRPEDLEVMWGIVADLLEV